ncbi:MAG: sigma-70 family RNA polymerase sigma factor [Acidobacteria bacterium]|nr:sigma-70 family RNA polymerase sigma factor [Acidobacteriota bacterium]
MRRIESLAADSATLHAYLQEIARFPPLDSAQERRLAERVRDRDEDALARLVEPHLGLVVGYARRYRHMGVPLLELVHDGNLALIDAARRFEPAHHGRFAAYALWWVRQGVLHRLTLAPERHTRRVDADSRTFHLVEALRVAIDEACNHGAGEDELSPSDIRLLGEQWRRVPEAELLVDDDSLDLDDLVPAPVDEQEDAVRLALVSDLETSLLELDPKERRVLALRLGLHDGEPRSLDQVGDRLRVSPARAERLSTRAIIKLRRHRAVRSSLN